MSIKAIYFDMGGVLLPLDMGRCVKAYREIAGFTDADKYLDPCHQHGFFLDIESGKMGLEDFFTECLSHCAPGTTRETVMYCQSRFFGTPKPDDVAFVKEIGQKYDVYMLSNNNPVSMLLHIPNFENAGLPLDKSFKRLFFSHEMHLLKPHPEIYLRAMAESGHSAGECLFIDDSQRNVDGAIAVGMHAVLFRPDKDNLRALVTSTLDELNAKA
ncbi:MAG: HAD family phosphatase [Bacteroidales bacterium]|nr:HAD family phosphatase [Bacteroidales bacterium]